MALQDAESSPTDDSPNLSRFEDGIIAVAEALKDIEDSTAYITIMEYNPQLDLRKLTSTSAWIRTGVSAIPAGQIPFISESVLRYRRLLRELCDAIPLTIDSARHFNHELEACIRSFKSQIESIHLQLGQHSSSLRAKNLAIYGGTYNATVSTIDQHLVGEKMDRVIYHLRLNNYIQLSCVFLSSPGHI
ncbi:hypothetical protein CPB84DRAFT_185707 [Gymnopilus junonius]|uniref:Uncharacterized protein n=1 Tax=Gymnopilus junonius TaxID=109634 RepID=A0A9P5TJT6_GYMJU|nr:hypothetical protein CPB84DRAFT_185707 [Gymnopilus junonius]